MSIWFVRINPDFGFFRNFIYIIVIDFNEYDDIY